MYIDKVLLNTSVVLDPIQRKPFGWQIIQVEVPEITYSAFSLAGGPNTIGDCGLRDYMLIKPDSLKLPAIQYNYTHYQQIQQGESIALHKI